MNRQATDEQTGQQVLECRSCGSSSVHQFLELGNSPVANRLIPLGADVSSEQKFPLGLMFCDECTLVQLPFELPADALFDENYPYFTSFAQTLVDHAATHARNLIQQRGLNSASLVVEVASNDGYLLRNFAEQGIPVLGIDPSSGPAAAAEQVGVPTLVEFFGEDLATKLVAQGKRADVILANNVMAHVPELNDFVKGMATLLSDDGVITVENPYVGDLIEKAAFDTVYHEHYCYFSCSAVDQLFQRNGLFLNHVEYFPNIHGGSCRWYGSKKPGRSAEAQRYLDDEASKGMDAFSYYSEFGVRVNSNLQKLREMLQTLKQGGASIAAYGAAAKGCTLLNSAGIGLELIDFVVDKNVHKQGHLLPGAHLPIVGTEQLLAKQPEYLLLLAWNFAEEIAKQEHEYLSLGGKFIVPVPEPKFL